MQEAGQTPRDRAHHDLPHLCGLGICFWLETGGRASVCILAVLVAGSVLGA